MRFQALFVFVLFLFPMMSHSSESSYALNGRVSLWARPACAHLENCPLPQRIDQMKSLSVVLKPPTEPGTVTRVNRVVEWKDYQLDVTFYWKLPPGEKSYVVTQSRILSRKGQLIAECNRFDFFENLQPFPVGICSGVVKDQQIGFSFMRNR